MKGLMKTKPIGRVPSKTEYEFRQKYKVGDKVWSSEIAAMFNKKAESAGGLISSLSRSKVIEPIYKDDTEVYWVVK